VCDRAPAVGGRGLCGPGTPHVPIAPTVMRIHEPASLDRTTSDDEPGHGGRGGPVSPELMAPRPPDHAEPLNRFGHSGRRVDQRPRPITADLRRSPTLAVGERALSGMLPVSCACPWSTLSPRRPSRPTWPGSPASVAGLGPGRGTSPPPPSGQKSSRHRGKFRVGHSRQG
jgi:hypothetical protein